MRVAINSKYGRGLRSNLGGLALPLGVSHKELYQEAIVYVFTSASLRMMWITEEPEPKLPLKWPGCCCHRHLDAPSVFP